MISTRRKLLANRALADQVRERAAYLHEPDRILVEQVIFNDVRPRELSVLTGLTPRGIQRRVRILVRRLRHPEVLFVLREHPHWPDEMSDVALAVWVRGDRLRDVAKQMELSLHAVRQHVENIRGLIGDSVFGRPRRRAGRLRNRETTGADAPSPDSRVRARRTCAVAGTSSHLVLGEQS